MLTVSCKTFAYHCAWILYTTEHGIVLIIFPLNLQLKIIAVMQSTEGIGVQMMGRYSSCHQTSGIETLNGTAPKESYGTRTQNKFRRVHKCNDEPVARFSRHLRAVKFSQSPCRARRLLAGNVQPRQSSILLGLQHTRFIFSAQQKC